MSKYHAGYKVAVHLDLQACPTFQPILWPKKQCLPPFSSNSPIDSRKPNDNKSPVDIKTYPPCSGLVTTKW